MVMMTSAIASGRSRDRRSWRPWTWKITTPMKNANSTRGSPPAMLCDPQPGASPSVSLAHTSATGFRIEAGRLQAVTTTGGQIAS